MLIFITSTILITNLMTRVQCECSTPNYNTLKSDIPTKIELLDKYRLATLLNPHYYNYGDIPAFASNDPDCLIVKYEIDSGN